MCGEKENTEEANKEAGRLSVRTYKKIKAVIPKEMTAFILNFPINRTSIIS